MLMSICRLASSPAADICDYRSRKASDLHLKARRALHEYEEGIVAIFTGESVRTKRDDIARCERHLPFTQFANQLKAALGSAVDHYSNPR